MFEIIYVIVLFFVRKQEAANIFEERIFVEIQWQITIGKTTEFLRKMGTSSKIERHTVRKTTASEIVKQMFSSSDTGILQMH